MAFFFILNEEISNRRIQRKRIRDYANPFDLPDSEFQFNYRLNKDMALHLCQQLEGDVSAQRSHGLPVHTRILTAVNYMANGAYQRKVGQDHNLAVAQTTVSKYLGKVVEAINRRLRPRWITFPGTAEARRRVSEDWAQKSGLPNILGAIDCTHVSIFPPPRPEGIQYLNRKNYHSINVQLVADANCKILHVNAQYPGRVHDQFIFNNSIIKSEMSRLHQNHIGEYYLLGDSGYTLEPWLMTPILNAVPGSPEDRYTQWHCQNRNVVERVNGYLKGSFRCLGLDQNLHYSPEKSCSIIYACCTLYNMMRHFRVDMEAAPVELGGESSRDAHAHDEDNLRLAVIKRDAIVNRYFN